MHTAEELPVEHGHLVGQILGAHQLKGGHGACRGALLVRERSLASTRVSSHPHTINLQSDSECRGSKVKPYQTAELLPGARKQPPVDAQRRKHRHVVWLQDLFLCRGKSEGGGGCLSIFHHRDPEDDDHAVSCD